MVASIRGYCVATAAVAASLLVLGCSSALAAAPAAGWTLTSFASPTNFSAADNALCESMVAGAAIAPCDGYQVSATNAGSLASENGVVMLTDTLPTGLKVQKVKFLLAGEAVGACETVTVSEVSTVHCEYPGVVQPDQALQMVVYVTVEGASGSLRNTATVSGGGARSVSTEEESRVSSASPGFGLSSFEFYLSGLDGLPDTQAGGHPYELTVRLGLNTAMRPLPNNGAPGVTSVQDLKDVFVDLPLGFAASDLAAPRCTLAQLSSFAGCPRETQVGELVTEPPGIASVTSRIWNMVPERGFAGEFGYRDALEGAHVFRAHVVPSPEGYVIQAEYPDIPQVDLTYTTATFYGDPALRDATDRAQVPYFTNPTDCSGGSLKATILMDSWQHPGSFNADGTPNVDGDPNWASKTSISAPVTGCDGLQFVPELMAQPTTSQADTPSGLNFELKLAQSENVATHATPALRNATVSFPEGMTVDPSSGQGLQACSAAQIGWLGGAPENFNAAPPACPEASKIGSLELESPLIPGVLTGAIYIARQNENPFGSVFATYVVVNDPTTGVVLKIAGELRSAPHTGRLTAFFPDNAQLPFSDLKLHFFGGPRAELATPESCGTFTTTSDLSPWSAPDSGPDATPFDSFLINEGCVNAFKPTFTAGSTNLQAGAFTSFVASFSRQDSDQEIGGLMVTLPPGLLANVGSVPQCSEAQIHQAEASTGGCPEASRVGSVTAGAGPGPNPLFVTGAAYLTGPYNGGPYGLAVVVPAIAGPFTFGNVVVRQSLRIDPHTAQVTDVSDPFPSFLEPKGANGQTAGVPIKLKRIDVAIDRASFAFNPTSCSKLHVAANMTNIQGTSATFEVPFRVASCATLKFAPKLQVRTSGNTSKANGASLHFNVSYPKALFGSQANIASVKVDLPKQLPSRLTTLQKACLAAQFQANPAGCPAASIIGHAKAITPILPRPLEGPIYFVSHGGEAFPSAIMVLQGNGVTFDLIGTTLIRKGITSTTFKTVPDAPVASFEATLPKGPHSALAANGNLCKTKLNIATLFQAQNGAVIHQTAPIAATSCPTRKASKHHPAHSRKH